MRKHLIALLGFLSGTAVYYIKAPPHNPVTVEEFHQQEYVTTTLAAPKTEDRKPAVIPVAGPPRDLEAEEVEDLPGLPRGMKLAPKVRAVQTGAYSTTLGPKLLEKNGFVFYRSETPSGTNVVYDRRLRTFHPIAATIKISGISPEERNELLKEWEEYHYNKDLGVQYIQSDHASLIEDFGKLRESGHRVDLEVIQAVYQTR